ncbi:NTP transferase domain-containing protein [Tumebacillus sp. ITR2]|uniref:NTP transferase domain-containing protein n=1 Tax=Tumebacillus amylolyticus TaxID=2801339 RepID=A0ABS1J7N6_9BACL|nr:sugar phosphate nucleotidyltransferase [Tumebacillus amylolyticus]MBL0386289.1 NTP transferase domain-containing protein [Tumebacillus amylolyticus]
MKAVILAGGKGSRLRPLTCNKPKPMVPLLGRPCMAYTLDLLRRTGIQDIGVTLQYMPDSIRNYFGDGHEHGVRMRYFEETSPLGTAGSVKNAAAFLDETFVVISGDALTDFHLLDAIRYHKEKGSLATIVLTRVETPLEYGVAITEPDGRIVRFLEKPSWGEVFSDTVNTGIYIFEREILDFIPDSQEFDFSKDLFPHLMNNGHDLYGYVADGYWSDIGNLAQYRQTQFDMLEGRVHVDIHGQRVAPRVWIGQGVRMADDVVLEEPCYIGRETVIGEGVTIGPYTVIGEGNILQSGASLKRTVIWNHNYVGEGVELRGATLCSQTCLETHAACFEGAVIGDACSIGAKAVVKPQVKLWPKKRVQEGVTAHTSLIWGEKLERHLFGMLGVQGICNVDMTPDFAGKLASAYGAALPFGARIAISCDEDPFSCLIKRAFAAGLHSAGLHTVDGGSGTTPMLRYAVRMREVQGGVHVRRIGDPGDDRLLIEFVDAMGLNLDKGLERKIENAFYQEDFRRANSRHIGHEEHYKYIREEYVADLLRQVDREAIQRESFRIVVQFDSLSHNDVVLQMLRELGCTVQVLESALSAQGELQALVAGGHSHIGVRLGSNGERMALVTEKGTMIEDDLLLALQVLVHFSSGRNQVAVPVTAPTIVELLAEQFGGAVVRTKANPRSLMEPMQAEPFPMLFDALYTLVRVMSAMAKSGLALSELLDGIPHFHILRCEVPCPWEEKGKVMRLLIEETKGETVELLDGIKVFTEGGWTLILPDSDGPMFQVYAQGVTKQKAEELADAFAVKIRDYQV